MTIIKTQVHNGRIDVAAPSDFPDGTEVTLTILPSNDRAPLSPEEIGPLLAAMQNLDRWTIPTEVASDLDDWERKINQHGIEDVDSSTGDVFR